MTAPDTPASEPISGANSRTRRKKQSPERLHLHQCFNAWVQHPEIECRYGALIAAMNGHELNERLRKLLPVLEGIPVQELSEANTFTNPPI